MAQKRWSLSVPLDGFSVPEHRMIAAMAESLGYTDAWSYEVDGLDGFTPLAVVASATSHMRVGTAIANVYTRGPATLAMTAAGLAEIAPGRFELGIGSGSQPIVEKWNDTPFDRPATRVREMALFLRQALAGEKVTMQGKTFSVEGFRLSRPPASPVPIHVAALRKGMLEVAGEVADGVILNWLSAEDTRKSVGVVREAARRVGRDPNSIEISARLMVSLDPVTPESDIVSRRHINAYLNVPVYKEFHRWLGRAEALQPMWDAWDAGDRKAAVAAVPEKVIDDLIVRGTPEERRQHVLRYMEAGIDTAYFSMATAEKDPARKREIMLQGVRDFAPERALVGSRR
jgi:probable F420-dependent oxidoreductase